MHKFLSFVFIIVVLVATSSFNTVSAEENESQKPSLPTKIKSDRELIKNKDEILKEKSIVQITKTQERREEKTLMIEEKKASNEARLEKRKEVREQIKERREEIKTSIIEKRQEAQEKFKVQKEEFKEKLETITDEKKQKIVEKMDARFTTINTEKTAKMSEAIEKLSALLNKLSEKAEVLQLEGKDTAELDAAISSADTALSDAQQAVETQAGKEYVISIQTESTLKTTVGTTMKQLQEDLKSTHKTILAAHEAVKKAKLAADALGKTTTATASGGLTQ